jgi:hypothetical protein
MTFHRCFENERMSESANGRISESVALDAILSTLDAFSSLVVRSHSRGLL